MIMQAGTYLIGDLCYVMHPQWDEVQVVYMVAIINIQ